jgi:hypothetical protein
MMNRRVFVPLYACAVIGVIAGLTSCSKPAAKAPEPQQAQANHVEVAPVELHHWVQHDELRALMVEIEEARTKTVATSATGDGATLHPSAHKGFAAASEAAKRLAIAAKKIPPSIENVQMTEEDRAEFKKQADALRDDARRLMFVARNRKAEPMHDLLDSIQATCISCHTRFRDVAGELQPPRV